MQGLDLPIRRLTGIAEREASSEESAKQDILQAASEGHANVSAYLIARGADVNVTDDWGFTPLHCAADYNDQQHTYRDFPFLRHVFTSN